MRRAELSVSISVSNAASMHRSTKLVDRQVNVHDRREFDLIRRHEQSASPLLTQRDIIIRMMSYFLADQTPRNVHWHSRTDSIEVNWPNMSLVCVCVLSRLISSVLKNPLRACVDSRYLFPSNAVVVVSFSCRHELLVRCVCVSPRLTRNRYS